MLRRWSTQVVFALLLVVGVLSWGILGMRGMTGWVFHVTKGSWVRGMENISPRDFAIVPGTGFHRGRPSDLMQERLELSLKLYQSGRVGMILVSGNEAPPGYEVSGMRNWLLERGVPSSHVIADPLGKRTLDTMTRAVAVFGIRTAVVCTQSWAAPRAVFLARAAGLDAVALVPPIASRRPNPFFDRENLKVTLAFLEHYIMGRTHVVPAPGNPLAIEVSSR